MSEHPQLFEFSFCRWRYRPALRRLYGNGSDVRLKPLLDRLLRRLLEEPGAVLPREQIIEQVWTRKEVNDEVLSRAIAELRAVLGDDAREPRFIETLPKGGYRWIAPVQRRAVENNAAQHADSGAKVAMSNRHRSRTMLSGALLALMVVVTATLLLTQRHSADSQHAALVVDLLAARPLTADPRLEHDARFDPVGRVVYIRSDRTNGASELLMVDPATLAERVLWQSADSLRNPAASPDGREIAVARWTQSGCELWSVTLIDLHRTRLGNCATDLAGGLEWTPDGSALLFSGAPADPQHVPGLMLWNRRDGALRSLTTPTVDQGAHIYPRLSRDGKHLAYASQFGSDRQLWWTDWPHMRQHKALLKRPEPVYGHAFEPSGDALWVAGDLTLYRALHRLRPGQQPELLGGRGARSVDLSANGAVVWAQADYDADVLVRTQVDGLWKAYARSNRYESHPEFSADGGLLALASNRSGSESVLVADLADGSVRQLALDPGSRWVRPTWSARGNGLIITAYEDQHTSLYRYDLDGDQLTALPGLGPDAFHGTELADRLIYFRGHGLEHSTLMQLINGQSKPEVLDIGPVVSYRASAKWLVWRSLGKDSLFAAPLPELGPVRELEGIEERYGEAFALQGARLYYLAQAQLWSVELDGGEPTAVPMDRLPDSYGPSLAVSSRGAFALTVITKISFDLMISTPSINSDRNRGGNDP